jgi:chromosome segregation ATPase
MAYIGKTLVRTGVITALVGGAAVAVAGPDRIGAIFGQTRDSIRAAIDDHIEDPVALRAQIKQLESQYPAKIAEVRSDLAEVQDQISQLEREMAVAQKVVELTSSDLASLDDTLDRAHAARTANPGAIVRVSFDARPMDMDDAFARRGQIEQTRDLYAQRAVDLDTDLGYLREQEGQLAELLTKLETERAEFGAKLFQLDAQIDTIARNERMIGMMEQRQATIDEHSRYQAHSLDQLTRRLSTIRSEQRSRIEAITTRERGSNYEDQAEFLIERAAPAVTPVKPSIIGPAGAVLVQPKVIDVGPEAPEKAVSPMASRD